MNFFLKIFLEVLDYVGQTVRGDGGGGFLNEPGLQVWCQVSHQMCSGERPPIKTTFYS